MTIKEALEQTMTDLGKISVPVNEIETVGMPICIAINNLRACLEAIDRDESKKAKAEAADGSEE